MSRRHVSDRWWLSSSGARQEPRATAPRGVATGRTPCGVRPHARPTRRSGPRWSPEIPAQAKIRSAVARPWPPDGPASKKQDGA